MEPCFADLQWNYPDDRIHGTSLQMAAVLPGVRQRYRHTQGFHLEHGRPRFITGGFGQIDKAAANSSFSEHHCHLLNYFV